MNSSVISIIDTGLGNIGSVFRIVERFGGAPRLCSNPTNTLFTSKVILPGVGHFDHGMTSLRQHGFDDSFWNSAVQGGCRILGICLGMQLLCRRSDEGVKPGLGLVDAEVKKFRFSSEQNLKVPHMGWNIVRSARSNPLIPSTDEELRFYFVHSYRVVPNDSSITIGTANYGGEFCAAFQTDNIFGVQFHPEKSHRFGMALIKRFMDL